MNVIVKPFFKSTSIRLHSWIGKGSLLHINRRRRHHISKKGIVIWSNLIIVRADHSTLVIIRSDQIMSPGPGNQGPFGKFLNIRPILWTPSSFRHVLVFWKCIYVHNYFVAIRMLQMSFWPNKGGSFSNNITSCRVIFHSPEIHPIQAQKRASAECFQNKICVLCFICFFTVVLAASRL